MITSKLRTYSLFVVIIFFGMLLGGATYEHLVFFPVYLTALPDSAVMVNGKYGLHTGTFWMLIHPILILSLITTLALNWKVRPRRRRILITVAVYFSIIVLTQIYFLPELGAFRHSPESSVPPAEWLARGQRWLTLSWLRGVVMYVATFPLLHALTIPANDPLTAPASLPKGFETIAAG
jgi:glucan phosphoethanolaminetransferase (alkaline phosphatase superfamily)